ncbi:STAS domain-containing protein [Streptomyces chrestomyceticus]|uniref:STAS domain-containing protein n=1 Tax=Streptomyces chrestomyceticus TaxID=68185 RepID=UPI0037BB0DE7
MSGQSVPVEGEEPARCSTELVGVHSYGVTGEGLSRCTRHTWLSSTRRPWTPGAVCSAHDLVTIRARGVPIQDYAMAKTTRRIAGSQASSGSANVYGPGDHKPPYAVQGFTVIELRGDLDLFTSDHASTLLEAAFTLPGPRMLADLRPVDFFDGSALSLLCRARRRAVAHGGYLGLVCVRPWHLRILCLAGLSEVLCPRPTVDQAIAAALLHLEGRTRP